jgi:magnesium chelatase family protein
MIGLPGSGKTMLAKRMPTILPPFSFEEALETTKIHSVAGVLDAGAGLVGVRPFRSPHHTISDAGLIGGGAVPRPGEVSLAHNGVLFLDELPEFRRNVLEVMRQPLEDGTVCIARASMSLTFPARFMLAAAMNPCPCGFCNDRSRECHCTQPMIQRYMAEISGPLLDRIDIHIDVPAVNYKELPAGSEPEGSGKIRERVIRAREIQLQRYSSSRSRLYCNAQMSPRHIRASCDLSADGERLLERAMTQHGMTARAHDRILKVARTIADLESSPSIGPKHIAEAIQYRTLDAPSGRRTNMARQRPHEEQERISDCPIQSRNPFDRAFPSCYKSWFCIGPPAADSAPTGWRPRCKTSDAAKLNTPV